MSLTIQKAREIHTEDPKLIRLTRGRNALVDAADYEWLSRYSWQVSPGATTDYAKRTDNETGATILMHREILGVEPGVMVDHISGSGLDNRRQNLRACTSLENSRNSRPYRFGTSRFKGVSWHRATSMWQAHIRLNGKGIYLGRFDDEVAAAAAYDREAALLFGEFANTNFGATQ